MSEFLIQEQKDSLEKSIEDWKGKEYEQVNDILVIGIRPV